MLDKAFLKLAHCLSPESAHNATLRLLEMGLGPKQNKVLDRDNLAINLWGLSFHNPLGLAAGFDKNARVMKGCFDLGFGFVEVGGITPQPQVGNPQPRLFRLPQDNAVINRMGFNNEGLDVFVERLKTYRAHKGRGIIGINVAKNTDSKDYVADYVTGIEKTAHYADFLVVNLSCPNVTGFTSMQEKSTAQGLLQSCRAALDKMTADKTVPLLVKISPDLDDGGLDDILEAATLANFDGIIATNTSVVRPSSLVSINKNEKGGLSGLPIKDLSTQMIAKVYQKTKGKLPIIGVGGIASAEDAFEKILAGASLVQLYTALVYQGPRLIVDIKAGLHDLLHRHGYHSVAQAVGKNNDEILKAKA